MKMMMIKMMTMLTMSISMLKTPFSMGLVLILQTMLMTLLMNKMMNSSWFMMITFLMMIGGLLIIFTYMSSIASNEKFKLNMNLTMMIMIMMLMNDELMNENQINEKQDLMNNFKMENISMLKLYNEKSMIMTMIMVMYLLLTMISITKIVKIHEGPLRMKTYE